MLSAGFSRAHRLRRPSLADALEGSAAAARTLAIFSDPDCPYCRRLEAEIKGLTDVTIYTFLMPPHRCIRKREARQSPSGARKTASRPGMR